LEKNKSYAEKILNILKPLTNENDIAMIKKHQKALMEGFTGLSYPEDFHFLEELF
jgi:hypothetical protein